MFGYRHELIKQIGLISGKANTVESSPARLDIGAATQPNQEEMYI